MTSSRASASLSASIARVRTAAATSVWIRTALLGVLAVGVTVGGVLAGALVVAPVVERATRANAAGADIPSPGASIAVATGATGASADATSGNAKRAEATIVSLPRRALKKALAARADLLATMPASMSRYVTPTLALISALSAAVALLVGRRRATTGSASDKSARRPVAAEPAGLLARLTPRSSGRIAGKRNGTPREVAALAADGASASDIAWRTKLPIDAVQLLLTISSGHRQLHPPTA